jgi:hypothetical protein
LRLHRNLKAGIHHMVGRRRKVLSYLGSLLFAGGLLFARQSFAADSIKGQLLGAGAPIAGSTVTLWAASAGDPKQLDQTKTGADGRFELRAGTSRGTDAVLYLTAKGGQPKASGVEGDNPAIALLAVVGSKPPAKVTVNEFTTVASVWTHAQFLDGTAIKGPALSLRIASGNVPNLVDVERGGYGTTIQDGQNSNVTPTMAIFGTLSDLLAACVTRVKADACSQLFSAATGPDGKAPTDTMAAARSIARNAAYKPERLFALLDAFYPFPNGPQGAALRPAPFRPYLSYAPSAWILGLKFTGGGISGPGKLGFDSEGNAWVGDNFIVGMQAGFQPWDGVWNGALSEFSPNGRPLSPMPTGFTGGGVFGPGFGTAVAADGKVWVSNNVPGRSISVFDKHGKPLSPPDGINFDHQLGAMQGVLVAPNGDVWVLDNEKNQLVLFPKGDQTKGRLVCKSVDGKSNENPCKLFKSPFHLVIDGKDRIWVSNAEGKTVVRFPAADPSRAEEFPAGGVSGKGMGIDSQGNVIVTNTIGEGLDLIVKARLAELKWTGKLTIDAALRLVFGYLRTHTQGSVSILRPDGTQLPGSPYSGGGISGPWGIAVDGNDHIFVSNFIGESFSELCGIRSDTCPRGMKTGDPISPPGGYVGGAMSMLTDIDIDPAGNVWAVDNWVDQGDLCFVKAPEALSTQCGGTGLTVFYGMAKPVRVPQIGLPRAP